MVSVTVTITEDAKEELKSLGWVNWSELAREEAKRKSYLTITCEQGR